MMNTRAPDGANKQTIAKKKKKFREHPKINYRLVTFQISTQRKIAYASVAFSKS